MNVFYATQVAIEPPTFVVFVNDVELMHFSYKRYLENQIRAAFGFEGTPIHYYSSKREINDWGITMTKITVLVWEVLGQPLPMFLQKMDMMF